MLSEARRLPYVFFGRELRNLTQNVELKVPESSLCPFPHSGYPTRELGAQPTLFELVRNEIRNTVTLST